MRYLIVSLIVACLFVAAGCQSDEQLSQCRKKNQELTAKIAKLERGKANMELATEDLIKAMVTMGKKTEKK